MTEFHQALGESLKMLSGSDTTVDECLVRYPDHAKHLRPLLRTVHLLNRGQNIKPSPTFNAYTRSAVIQHARIHSRQARSTMPMFQRTALAFALMVVAFLITGTAHAQSALPGDTDYPLKLASEQIWRAFSTDPVGVDVAISQRRLHEWLLVAHNSLLNTRAMNDYLASVSVLETVSGVDSYTRVVPAIQSQRQALQQAGLLTASVEAYLTSATSASVAASTPYAPTVVVFSTHIPPTSTKAPTQIPPTSTNVPSTPTLVPPTATVASPTATMLPPTATEISPTPTNIPPTETSVPPTETEVPPTDTEVPPTVTPVPPTNVPPTEVPTEIVPPDTEVAPTSTQAPPPTLDATTTDNEILP